MKDYSIKIYIAGKISGKADYKISFANFAAELKEEYPEIIIINPAVLPEGLTNTDYMRLSFAMIDSSDMVVFMPNADDSAGAQLEKMYCKYTGKIFVQTQKDLNTIIHCPACSGKPSIGQEEGKYFLIDSDVNCPYCGEYSKLSLSKIGLLNSWNLYAAMGYARQTKGDATWLLG